ncbi:arylsulfatase A-like enzyme [Haloferula luteola]|uniref:Arylsulfatase A-like enzyme n=1 Tax=Haloferula luteola TaxID=595692 RepID=A0A840V0F3_9BACT|nr:arylsulfatase [Haloferula luteola]MBB5351465.1 arylsulfatase A-like enzyme [Haloferula luteola]
MKFHFRLLLACLLSASSAAAAPKPNVVVILADDLGYGDVHALHSESRIATPALDQLAREGMIFTDAHSSSSVCTPSRYSLLTGRYAWRTHLQKGVLGGFAPPLIAPDRLTLASFLREQGYTTACVGKWHLGMTLSKDGKGTIPDGPLTRGFDHFFGISASLDMPPYAFFEDDHFTAPLDTQKAFFPKRLGPAARDFEAIDVLPSLTDRAVKFIRKQAASPQPFLLYLPLTSPHTPIAPTSEWKGKSPMGSYADFVMQTDDTVRQIMAALKETDQSDHTLLVFSSDNGFAPAAGTQALESQGHFPSAGYRGYKSDIWEGGHRIPLIVRLPGITLPGSKSTDLVCLGDLIRTCSDLLEVPLPAHAGEDSISFLPSLRGQPGLRTSLIHHSENGNFAIRQGNWKLEFCPGSGGWGNPTNKLAIERKLPSKQLYRLSSDPAELSNLYHSPDTPVADLTRQLRRQISSGRSTSGPDQPNDVEVAVEFLH